jgi:hypothetical protein
MIDGTEDSLKRFASTYWGKMCIGDLLEICANNSGLQSKSNIGGVVINGYIKSIFKDHPFEVKRFKHPINGHCSLCNRTRKVTGKIVDADQDETYYFGPKCGAMLNALGSLATKLVCGPTDDQEVVEFWDQILELQFRVQARQELKGVRRKSSKRVKRLR